MRIKTAATQTDYRTRGSPTGLAVGGLPEDQVTLYPDAAEDTLPTDAGAGTLAGLLFLADTEGSFLVLDPGKLLFGRGIVCGNGLLWRLR